MDFFKDAEITFLGQWGNVVYDRTNKTHRVASKKISQNLWGPSREWADLLMKQVPSLKRKGKADWKESAGKSVFRFKHYTWYRLYPDEYYHPDFFFTIGVDGKKHALIIKIDYQREKPKLLNESQILYLKQTIIQNNGSPFWTAVPIQNYNEYTWEALTKFSVDFVNKSLPVFIDLFRNLQSLSVENRIARLTWNTNGWVMPSGSFGKSDNRGTHEGRHGYGHEEWLFDISKTIDGYHYGFLEPIRKQQNAYSNKFYNVWLYTIDGASKKRFFVGEIKNVEVLNKKKAEEIKKKYIEVNWLEQMEQQIVASGASAKGFSDWKGVDLFNVRFRSIDIEFNDPYIELQEGHEIYEQSRYTFAHLKEAYRIPTTTEDELFQFNEEEIPEDDDNENGLKTKIHSRPPKAVQITYLHDKISKSLTKYLKNLYGAGNVKREHPAGYGGNRIDIVVRDKGRFIFYEIKTYTSLRTSIREALGQIIEYHSWPNKRKADELIIVTQPHKHDEQVKSYIKHIGKMYGLPLRYQSFDWEKLELSQ